MTFSVGDEDTESSIVFAMDGGGEDDFANSFFFQFGLLTTSSALLLFLAAAIPCSNIFRFSANLRRLACNLVSPGRISAGDDMAVASVMICSSISSAVNTGCCAIQPTKAQTINQQTQVSVKFVVVSLGSIDSVYWPIEFHDTVVISIVLRARVLGAATPLLACPAKETKKRS